MNKIFGATNVNGVAALSEVCGFLAEWMQGSAVVQAVFGNVIVDYDEYDVDPDQLNEEFYSPLKGGGIDLGVFSAHLHPDAPLGGNALFAVSKMGGIKFGDPSDVKLSGIFLDGVEYVVHVFDGVSLEIYSECDERINELLISDGWVVEAFPGMLGTYLED